LNVFRALADAGHGVLLITRVHVRTAPSGYADRGCRFALTAPPRVRELPPPVPTALDATVQKQVLNVFRALADAGHGVLLITHDLSVVAAFPVNHVPRVPAEGMAASRRRV
jgi:ABC-type taurine transport system ATPase subunit